METMQKKINAVNNVVARVRKSVREGIAEADSLLDQMDAVDRAYPAKPKS